MGLGENSNRQIMSKISRIQKTYLETTKKALDNSSAWLDEANYLLFEKKSYGHSYALAIFSIEETVKALVCFSVVIGSAEPEEELVEAVFKYHYDKMATLLACMQASLRYIRKNN